MRLFHFTNAKHAQSAIANQRLKVARISELNDPFELLSHDLPDPNARRAFSAFKIRASKSYGLLCFSRFWRNPLQWSHYADRHRGVALEFEVADDALQKVRYVADREPFDYSKIVAAGGFSEEDAGRILATKSRHWRYEREFRVAIDFKDCSTEGALQFYKFNNRLALRGVVLGALCTLGSDDIQKKLPAGMRIHVRKARLAFRSFSIVPLRTHGIRHVLGDA